VLNSLIPHQLATRHLVSTPSTDKSSTYSSEFVSQWSMFPSHNRQSPILVEDELANPLLFF
jgi:hypothetical protein